jgi:methyl coenzyme M reductase gamma subunit
LDFLKNHQICDKNISKILQQKKKGVSQSGHHTPLEDVFERDDVFR